MRQIATESELNELIAAKSAVMVLFGGSHCGVCQAIKPRLMELAGADFPHLATAWVDCGVAGPLCAAQRVFSLPVVQLWFEGQPFDRFVRAFPLAVVRQAIERPYEMLFSGYFDNNEAPSVNQTNQCVQSLADSLRGLNEG